MFLANNTVFLVEKACYEIFRLNIYSYQRLCCEKKMFICLFGIPIQCILKKIKWHMECI